MVDNGGKTQQVADVLAKAATEKAGTGKVSEATQKEFGDTIAGTGTGTATTTQQ
ncbi:MAG TPA: hypothetical protein VFZ58_02790 [Candidatus Saccharimonadales bacterium]